MKNLSLTLSLLLVMFSCSNDDFESDISSEINNKVETISFIYNDKTYSSTFQYGSDSILIFNNNEFAELYENLNQLPNLATLVINDKLVEYFDNSDILKETLKSREEYTYNSELNTLRNLDSDKCPSLYNIKLYDKPNYSGRMVSVYSVRFIKDGKFEYISLPRLNYFLLTFIDFDNKLASISITPDKPHSYNGLTVIFYDDLAYKGKSRTYTRLNSLYEADFSKYLHTQPSVWHHSKYWNQVISSIQLILN